MALLKHKTADFLGYVFASATRFWQDGHTDTMDTLKIKHFLSSRLGIFKPKIDFKEAVETALTMYCVAIKGTGTEKDYACDCKNFYHYTECSHVVAAMTLEKDFDLVNELSLLTSGKQRGRPRNYIPVGFAAHKPNELASSNQITVTIASNMIGSSVAKKFGIRTYTGKVVEYNRDKKNGDFSFKVNYPVQFEGDELAEDEEYSMEEIQVAKKVWIHYMKEVDEKNKDFCSYCFDRGHLENMCPLNSK